MVAAVVAVAALAYGAWWWVESSRDAIAWRVADFRALDAQHDCCDEGAAARAEPCRSGLASLVEVHRLAGEAPPATGTWGRLVAWARGTDRAAATAGGDLTWCPAARELALGDGAPADVTLCGFFAGPGARQAAARTLAGGRVLGQVAARPGCAEGADAAFAVMREGFVTACGADACLPFLASRVASGGRSAEAVLVEVARQRDAVQGALPAFLEAGPPAAPAVALARRALDAEVATAAALVALLGPGNLRPADPLVERALVDQEAGSGTLAVLRKLRANRPGDVGAVAAAVLELAGDPPMTAEELAEAARRAWPGLLDALLTRLDLRSAVRADILAPAMVERPPVFVRSLLDERRLAFTPATWAAAVRLLATGHDPDYASLERVAAREAAAGPAAVEILLGPGLAETPTPTAIRLLGGIATASRARKEGIARWMAAPDPALRAAAAAAAALAGDMLPTVSAARDCVAEHDGRRHHRATADPGPLPPGARAPTGPQLWVCGGPPLTGAAAQRLAAVAGVSPRRLDVP